MQSRDDRHIFFLGNFREYPCQQIKPVDRYGPQRKLYRAHSIADVEMAGRTHASHGMQ
jgi:hypothetical protein